MKNLKYFVLVILIAGAGCGKDGFEIFNTDVKLSKSFNINVPAQAPTNTVTLSSTFDATSDPEVKEVVDQIDRYEVNSVTYSISEYSGEPTMLEEGVITVKSDDGTTLGSITITNVNLQALNNAGEQELAFKDSDISNIEAALKEDHQLTLNFTATIDNKPVAFKLSTFMDITVQYRVFD